ncbi:MAG: nucleotidyltransferase [Roseburia sp.]|nr:nucleotidyltransferase [Roseburia sp.]
MLSKDEIERYLQALSEKIYGRFGPSANIKIIIVGGAAIALNYSFRDSTMDVDTYSRYSVELDDLVQEVAKDYGIEKDWLSHNMMVTQSCTSRLTEFTLPYKLYSGVLDVQTVDTLSLICMKSVACRPDSHDMEDIVNLLDNDASITFADIRERFQYLYGDWSLMKIDAQMYLSRRFNAMPPDMYEFMLEQLPPAVKYGKSSEELYTLCEEAYRYLR